MDEEIDLRPYFELLLRNWMWIIGGAVLAALVAFGVSSLIPPTYEAKALVAITEERDVVQFDPRIRSTDERQPLQAYPELATSDELLQNLLSQLDPPLPEIETVEQLRGILEANPGSDPSLVRLLVQYGDPGEAARVANAWAALFVSWANRVYGDQNGDQVLFFEEQLAEAKVALETAEEALIAFQDRNRAAIISNELDSLEETHADHLAIRRSSTFIIQDARGLRDQLAEQRGSTVVTFADQLTALFLQLKTFNTETDGETVIPLQLQFNNDEALTSASRSEQIAFLDGLVNTLETKAAQIDARLEELEPQILALQQERQQIETEEARLVRNRDVAEETYTALARKVEEERITSQEAVSGVRLASRAAVPEDPVSPRRLLVTGVAGTLGLALSVGIVFLLYWWQEGAE